MKIYQEDPTILANLDASRDSDKDMSIDDAKVIEFVDGHLDSFHLVKVVEYLSKILGRSEEDILKVYNNRTLEENKPHAN